MTSEVASETYKQGVSGTVKWFSNRKGFGFLAASDGQLEEEIFVHQTGIVTDGQFRTLQESSEVKFDVEKETETGKLKAVNVTNTDGTPIVPPPRKPKAKKTDTNNVEAAGGDANGEAQKPKARNGTVDEPKTPRDPPFHSVLADDVRQTVENDRGLVLGQRTTVDVAYMPHARIKLGQGGYAALALQTAVIAEGTYTCAPDGTVTLKWDRALQWSAGEDNASSWKSHPDMASLVQSIVLTDERVGAVQPTETAATLWGADKPDPKSALEENGFQMRRVVLTRPPARGRAGGGGAGRGGGRFRGRRNNKSGGGKASSGEE